MPPVCWILYELHHEDQAPALKGFPSRKDMTHFGALEGETNYIEDKEKGA